MYSIKLRAIVAMAKMKERIAEEEELITKSRRMVDVIEAQERIRHYKSVINELKQIAEDQCVEE